MAAFPSPELKYDRAANYQRLQDTVATKEENKVPARPEPLNLNDETFGKYGKQQKRKRK